MTITQATSESAMDSSEEIVLSIITVVRNDAQRLSKTINSLVNFYGDRRFEHIVIDGKSSDQTLAVLRQNSEHMNFHYLSETDNGIYYGMNKGIALAKGRFMLFLNCGDRMASAPDLIIRSLKTAGLADSVDIVCFCSRMCYGTHTSVLIPQAGRLHKMPTSHQAMVFSRTFMQAHIYDTRYRIAADFNLYLSADSRRVLVFTGSEPLTDIEAAGVASQNPWHSYKEYLRIAAEKLHGSRKWITMIRIACKALAAILLKSTLPKAWLDALGRRA